jgi:serine protease Do
MRGASCRRPCPSFAALAAIVVLLCRQMPCSAQPEALAESQLTSGVDVRHAFETVVSGPRQWTVEVLTDDKPVALGTVVSPDGWILTKASQLQGDLTCRLCDGRTLEAEYCALEPDQDLALLKVGARDLTSVRWLTGRDADVGVWLATPGLETDPVAVGIVSAARRPIPFQHISGVLGIRLDMADGPALVAEIIADSAAAKADLRAGDVIKRVGNRDVENRVSLIETIRKHEPGATVQLTIQRGETEMVVSATLPHPFGEFLSRIAVQNQMGGRLSPRRTGFPAVLQHDTVLGPEHCGGSVVNLDGMAVGTNIARAGRTETYAIPADVVLDLIARLQSGQYPPPYEYSAQHVPPMPPSAEPAGE